jgi:putative glutathione S-transferase
MSDSNNGFTEGSACAIGGRPKQYTVSADKQSDYEKAYDAFFALFDVLEKKLATDRYLLGDAITDADVQLYAALVRFDVAYYTVFRLNRNRLSDFPNLWAYARELHQTPGIGDKTDFEAIKRAYYLSDKKRNPYQILAKGPDLSGWNEPSDRPSLKGGNL